MVAWAFQQINYSIIQSDDCVWGSIKHACIIMIKYTGIYIHIMLYKV